MNAILFKILGFMVHFTKLLGIMGHFLKLRDLWDTWEDWQLAHVKKTW